MDKPVLNFKEEIIRFVNDDDFDKFVNQIYCNGKNKHEFAANNEARNDSYFRFTVPEKKYSYHTYDDEIRNGTHLSDTGSILRVLHEDGYLEAGVYIIKVSW